MTDAAPPALAVDVSHTLGEFHLGIDLRIDGGLAVIVGPSGSGKSTTLELVAGLLRPDRGTISIVGDVVADAAGKLHVSTQDRRLGMVFQEGLLLPHRTVRDNVALAVRDGDRAARRDRALALLDRVGASGFAHRHPRELSGGQRQRVALARALAGDPRLLLLDEPLSALDRPVRAELRALLRDVVDSSAVPTLFVTHDQADADELADTLVTFDHGSIASVERRSRPAPMPAGATGRRGRPSATAP